MAIFRPILIAGLVLLVQGLPVEAQRATERFELAPAGYVPSSLHEYLAARDLLANTPPGHFNYWKAQNLKTPEQMIRDHWDFLLKEAQMQQVPVALLAGYLLNEMRALVNEDYPNDVFFATEDMKASVLDTFNRLGVSVPFPSTGIAQLKANTIIKRDLFRHAFNDEELQFQIRMGAPVTTRISELSREHLKFMVYSLTSPLFSIRVQAAHIRLMYDHLQQATWDLAAADGRSLPLTGAELLKPGGLSGQVLEAVTEHMLGKGLAIERSVFTERLANGHGSLYVLAHMIDNLWEDKSAQVPLVCDPLWGEAVYIAVRDIEQHLLGETPQWDAFLADRKLYDEEGYYGPKGRIIEPPDELKDPVLPLQAEAK